MRSALVVLIIMTFAGCQSARTVAYKGGEGVGQTVGATDSFTVGVADGYANRGEDSNPYHR